MVGMGVGDEVRVNVHDRQAERCQGFRRPGPTVDEHMVLSFDDQRIVLVEFLCKRIACTDKE